MGRRHLESGERASIRPGGPRRGPGRRGGRRRERIRFNWQTPFILSAHNSKIYYVAGNKVFRSLDRGNRLRAISPDITATERGSATALAESPRDENVLYVGTDDGGLWMTRDGGHEWHDLFAAGSGIAGAEASANEEKAVSTQAGKPEAPEEPASDQAVAATGAEPEKTAHVPAESAAPEGTGERAAPIAALLPGRRWVSALVASKYAPERVYATFDGHRQDDDLPWVFVSNDYGRTWESLRANLPDDAGSVRTIAEDMVKENVLWLGTEFGAWISWDGGGHWSRLNTNLPTVAVHEFAQHEASGEVVAATHGRSLWVIDATALRQLDPHTLGTAVQLFKPNDAIIWRRHPSRGNGNRTFVGQNPPSGAEIFYALPERAGDVKLTITRLDGERIRTLETKSEPGLHRVLWDLRAEARQRGPGPRRVPAQFRGRLRRRGPRVAPGTYRIVLEVSGETHTQTVNVVADPDEKNTQWLEFEAQAERLGLDEDAEEDGAGPVFDRDA